MTGPFGPVRFEQRVSQGVERRVDDALGRPARTGRRHLAFGDPVEDPLPQPERLPVAQVMPEGGQVERRLLCPHVALEARRLEQRRHVRLERSGAGAARDEARDQQRQAHRQS